FCGRSLGRLFVGNDPADGGENLLHRGLLTLRRLRHWPRPPQTCRGPSPSSQVRISAIRWSEGLWHAEKRPQIGSAEQRPSLLDRSSSSLFRSSPRKRGPRP